MIEISICLSDIDKNKIQTSKNGKKYLNLILAEKKEKDQYGNTHTIWVKQSKEEREKKEKINYIGNGKEIIFEKKEAVKEIVQTIDDINDNTDDLPF